MPSFPVDLTLSEDSLVLSLPVEADLEALVRACRDPEIVRFTRVPSPYEHEDGRSFIASRTTQAKDGASLELLVRDESGQLLGACGLMSVDWEDRSGEIGYWVAPWARRQGVATRATYAICRYAFDTGFERLYLHAATVNAASNAVARRLGFVHEGTLRAAVRARASETGGVPGRRQDMNAWGLLPGELASP